MLYPDVSLPAGFFAKEQEYRIFAEVPHKEIVGEGMLQIGVPAAAAEIAVKLRLELTTAISPAYPVNHRAVAFEEVIGADHLVFDLHAAFVEHSVPQG